MGSAWHQKEGMKMLKDNLVQLRKYHSLTQEDVAAKIGVSRLTVAKWESGETSPDLENSRLLAELFGVSLDDLVSYDSRNSGGLGVPPKGKHIFGVVTVGDKGQLVIPARARKVFEISPGDQLLVLGDEATGLAVIKTDGFMAMAEIIRNMAGKGGAGE